MKRIMLLVTVALVMAAMIVAMAMPAFADKGGAPHDPSCGVGRSALIAIRDPEFQEEPGASEISQPEFRPQETNCPPPQQPEQG